MIAVRIDIDGTVDTLHLKRGSLDDLRKAIGGGWVDRVNCGEVGRITTKTKHPQRILSMWVDDEGALGATGMQVNPLAMAVLTVLGLDLAQNLYGPVVFTEADHGTGETTGLQPATKTVLEGVAHRMTVDNLDFLAARNTRRSWTAVFHTIDRPGIEILDTTDPDDVRRIAYHQADPGVWTIADAERLLDTEGWYRTGPWRDAEWLYEGEPTDGQLSADIRKK